MVDYQTVSIIFAGISIMIASLYYIMNIRHQQETREASLFNSVYESMLSPEIFKISWELFLDWQYTDYDDFIEKYGPDTNRDMYLRFNKYFTHLEGMGIYVKRGLIRAELIDDFMSGDVVGFWEKFSPFILEHRKRHNAPTAYEHVEYLYNKVKPIRDQQHPESQPNR
jgi:hypothetical protein